MSLIHCRPGRLESVISLCLLVILLLIGVGVFVKQLDTDSSRFGIEATAAGLSSEIPETPNQEEILVSSFIPAGFGPISQSQVYNPENLYEKINGKAPLYLESGFKQLTSQGFVSKNDEDSWFELSVYDMATARNAFSVYSIQRRADADILSVSHTHFGYRTSNGLYFVHGKHYVELVGSAESRELFNAMVEISVKMRQANLGVGNHTQIAELELFSQESFVQGSAKLYLVNAFGFDGWTDVFSAQYKIDGETITGFFSKYTSPEEALKIAKSYYDFLISNGAVDKTPGLPDFGISYPKVVDFYGSIEIIFTNGSYVAGIHEVENLTIAEKVAVMLDAKLNQVQKQK